jgi:hypothetical protein
MSERSEFPSVLLHAHVEGLGVMFEEALERAGSGAVLARHVVGDPALPEAERALPGTNPAVHLNGCT